MPLEGTEATNLAIAVLVVIFSIATITALFINEAVFLLLIAITLVLGFYMAYKLSKEPGAEPQRKRQQR